MLTSSLVQGALVQLQHLLLVLLALLSYKPFFGQHPAVALFIQATTMEAYRIIHTRQAILATSSKNQRVGDRCDLSGTRLYGQGNTLHRKKMLLHRSEKSVDKAINCTIYAPILCEDG